MRKLTEKQALFKDCMFTPGSETFGNGVKSAQKAGYKGSYNVLAQIAHKMVNNGKIVLAKKQIQAENEAVANKDRNYCIKKAVYILENSKNECNRLKALSLLADFIGAKREHAPNTERESAKLERMDAEAKRLAERLAVIMMCKPVVSVAVSSPETDAKAITGQAGDNVGPGTKHA